MKGLTIVSGHYGTGKTNLSVNMAVDAALSGKKVTLIDADVVNPYFRTADHTEFLRKLGVKVLSPTYANTNVDVPALPEGMSAALDDEMVIIDAGGDDAGALVLGYLSDKIRKKDHDMLYVINRYRPMISDPDVSVSMLRAIESVSRLKATGIVNNSHLKDHTEADHILGSIEYAERTAELAGIPLMFTTYPKQLSDKFDKTDFLYPVDIYVKTPWEKEGG